MFNYPTICTVAYTMLFITYYNILTSLISHSILKVELVSNQKGSAIVNSLKIVTQIQILQCGNAIYYKAHNVPQQ